MRGGGWEQHGGTILTERFYGCRDEQLNAQYAFVDGVAPPALLALPALFLPEVNWQESQMAHVGTIQSARKDGADIYLEYVFDSAIPPIPVRVIIDLAPQLDIRTGGWALHHQQWWINTPNLYRALLRGEIARGPSPTVFQLDNERRDPKLVGVMMPFAPTFNRVYEAIRGAARQATFRCERVDKIFVHAQIMQTIISLICQSRVIIADCSGRNPNVFYEAGIAHTLGRDVILIAQNIKDIPFDLRHLTVIVYKRTPEGLAELTAKLKDRIQAVAERRHRI